MGLTITTYKTLDIPDSSITEDMNLVYITTRHMSTSSSVVEHPNKVLLHCRVADKSHSVREKLLSL